MFKQLRPIISDLDDLIGQLKDIVHVILADRRPHWHLGELFQLLLDLLGQDVTVF